MMASGLLLEKVISKQGGRYEETTFIDRSALLGHFLWVKYDECHHCGGWQSAAEN